MRLKVLFEDSPIDCESDVYIQNQPEWQRAQLLEFSQQLEQFRRIDHPDARRLEDDKWSLWTRRDGEDAVNHICFLVREDAPILSDFARNLLAPSEKLPSPSSGRAKNLVIMTVDTHAVAIGKAEEHIEVHHYASLMDAIKRDVFLQVIDDIRNSRPSDSYSVNTDGSLSIHINRPELAYGVHIHCTARWV